MGKYKNKTYCLRIDNNLMEKIKVISEKESRKRSEQLEYIIKEYVNKYEAEHGTIQVELED